MEKMKRARGNEECFALEKRDPHFFFLVLRERKPTERLKREHKWKVPMDSSVFYEANILRLSPHCGVRRAWLRRRFISSLFRRLILTNARRWKGFLHFPNSIIVKIWR